MNRWISDGFRLKGSKNNLGFLFFYELMTNSLQFKLLKDDETYHLGALLTRLMPPKDTGPGRKGLMISILKMLSYNILAAKDPAIPKFKDDRTFKLSTMIKGASSSFSNLLKQFKKFAQAGTGTVAGLRWPSDFRTVPQPSTTGVLPSEKHYLRDRRWVTTRVRDFSCSVREFGLADGGQGINIQRNDLKSFFSFPLFPITLSNFATNPTRAERGLPKVSDQLPFDVQRHPAARSHVAQSMIQRLKDDCKIYADEQNLGTVWKFLTLSDKEIETYTRLPSSPGVHEALAKVENLISLLQGLKQKDLNYVNVGIQRVLELANEFEAGSISHTDSLNADGSYNASKTASKLAKEASAFAASSFTSFAAPPSASASSSAGGLPLATTRKFVMPDQSTAPDWQELKTEDNPPKTYYYNSVTSTTSWDKPDALKTRMELEIEFELQWEELLSDSEHKYYFFCASNAKSIWTIPHARQIKFIPGSVNQRMWAAEMRKLGYDPGDKPAPPPAAPPPPGGAPKHAPGMLAAMKSAVSSAVSAVTNAVRERSNSGKLFFNIHPPQSPFLLTTGSNNLPALAFVSARHSGGEPTIWFEYLVTSLLSTRQEFDLRLLNPFLTSPQIELLRNIIVSVMFHTNRIGQINRCLLDAFDLLKLIKALQRVAANGGGASADVSLKQALSLKATTLATGLATKRHYLREARRGEGNIPIFAYDPRYLVFEFSDNLILRDTQVSLIDRFVQTTQIKGESMCTQMIMGQGKTTVVGPLLALILGDGKQLVTQVVPQALLDFSRGCMRSIFSSLIQKPILTFVFNRFQKVDPALHRKLLKARERRAVVVASPTSIKSFSLKFIEVLHNLDRIKNEEIAEQSGGSQASKSSSGGGILGALGLGSKAKERRNMVEERAAEARSLRAQAAECVKVLQLFREGSLLLDEVDLILHPLKSDTRDRGRETQCRGMLAASLEAVADDCFWVACVVCVCVCVCARSELNWPLGKKEALDFTRSKIGPGLRFEIPYHILDALFYAVEGKLVVPFHESREAMKLLDKIKLVVERGMQAKLMQRTPHLVLLNTAFYHKELRPLLASWSMLFLSSKRLSGLTDDEIRTYLTEGPKGPPMVVAAINAKLSTDYVKMINLTYEWLSSFLPFVLQKIDRVSFGLLSPDDLHRALKIDPRVSKAR